MTRFYLLFLLLVAIAVPFATADTIQLTNTNLSGVSNIGFVTLTAQGGGVMVTLTANSGFSFKTQGGDILFSTSVNLNASNISGIMINGVAYTGKFAFGGPATRAGNTFTYDLTKLNIHGITSATTISFLISGVSVQDLKGAWGVHFCVGGGTNCGLQTGFATNGSATVPEPGTLSLLGTGILGLAGFFRRRLLS
jgi:hypothetical protein